MEIDVNTAKDDSSHQVFMMTLPAECDIAAMFDSVRIATQMKLSSEGESTQSLPRSLSRCLRYGSLRVSPLDLAFKSH